VLLGASTLTRGFRTVVGAARARLGAPLEVLAALGHGRSYGLDSTFLGRTLPSIARSGLWSRLAEAPPAETCALLCDVGNDVAYGVAPEVLAGWLGRTLDRLERAGARPVLVGLPVHRIEALAPAWFAFWSRCFFPGRGLERERVLASARAVEAALVEQARARGLALVAPRPDWFGADPIHYARSRADEAWGRILAPFGERLGADAPPPLARVPLPPPAERWLLGRHQTRKQPAARLSEGTTLSIY
jgi:hypothetical protein